MRQPSSLLRVPSFFLFLTLLVPLTLFGQTRTTWTTAADIRNNARGTMVGLVGEVQSNSFTLIPDRDRNGARVRVTTDSIVTRYLGFGNTTGEVFTGANGFSRLRNGDRVEVRGIGDAPATIGAEELLLLGRNVTPSGDSITVGATRSGTVEGIVRSLRAEDNRIVLETDRREMVTILGTASTPVYHEGGTYRIRNIEVGDRIRIEVDSSSSSGIRPKLIDVLTDATPESRPGENGRTVASVTGRVSRLDTRAQTFRIEDDRGRITTVDARAAFDRAGNRFRLTDLQNGDELEVSGEYATTGVLRADTIRFRSDAGADDPFGDDRDGNFFDYTSADLIGTVDETYADNSIMVTDQSGRRVRVLVDPDFMVRNKQGTYIRATQLKRGDRVEIQSFRDRAENLIAQVIRIR